MAIRRSFYAGANMQRKHKSFVGELFTPTQKLAPEISTEKNVFNTALVINSIIYVIFVSSTGRLHGDASNVNTGKGLSTLIRL